jgi:seryl-tRNA synthetase
VSEQIDAVQAERLAFRDELFASRILIDGGVDGLYQRSGAFERIVRGVEALASRSAGGEGGEQRFLPPIIARTAFDQTDYVRSFPDLLGVIEVFRGGDREHRELLRAADDGQDWTHFLGPAEVVMSSASCHSLYSTLDKRVPENGVRYEVTGICFRHEPSVDPVRMQSFRMQEFVYVGDPPSALAHREMWIDRAVGLLAGLGLDIEVEPANDPFFGRAGQMLAANQEAAALKFELTSPVSSTGVRTAIASGNYHETHFGDAFALRTADGQVSHSACFAFGLDRIALALIRRHGTTLVDWPTDVASALQL